MIWWLTMFLFPMGWVSRKHKLQVGVIKGNDVAKTKQKDILFVILSFMIFLSIRNDKSHEFEVWQYYNKKDDLNISIQIDNCE